MKFKPNLYFFLFFVLSLWFSSCQSVRPPRKIAEKMDYTNEDVIATEVERINKMIEREPVRALWRSLLLGKKETIDITIENLKLLFINAIENKEYTLAKKYFSSLKNAGCENIEYSSEQINSLYYSDIPGLSGKNTKAPKSIADCMEGTVTIWVDRGLKVEYGAGFADIVLGSGFFIDERGYIITNHHVIESLVDPKYEGYARLYIKLFEDQDTKVPAKVIGYDSILDLALLKVELEPKVVFNLGSSSDLKVGDKISAIGTPVGLEGTLTSGIVSSTDRKLLTIGNVFQIDAAINSGNSGGPLIDENMNVQAVVFAGMLQYQGLNFAIPIEYLRQELNSLYRNEIVVHPWIGAYGHTKRNGKKKVGLEIQYVMPGGTAFLSGLKEGDVITEIDGNKISSLEDYHYLMMAYENETIVNCKYISTSKTGENDNNEIEKTCLLYLEQRPENPSIQVFNSDFYNGSFIPLFGVGLSNSSTLNKNFYTINKVIKGTLADELNLSVNDPIIVKEVRFDKDNELILALINANRIKNGFLTIGVVLYSSYDSPYYL